jgi:hypothetical protein
MELTREMGNNFKSAPNKTAEIMNTTAIIICINRETTNKIIIKVN